MRTLIQLHEQKLSADMQMNDERNTNDEDERRRVSKYVAHSPLEVYHAYRKLDISETPLTKIRKNSSRVSLSRSLHLEINDDPRTSLIIF